MNKLLNGTQFCRGKAKWLFKKEWITSGREPLLLALGPLPSLFHSDQIYNTLLLDSHKQAFNPIYCLCFVLMYCFLGDRYPFTSLHFFPCHHHHYFYYSYLLLLSLFFQVEGYIDQAHVRVVNMVEHI